jgi:trehalose synthase-fused probable maltokinase
VIEQLQAARWFGAKNRPIRDTRVIDRASWVPGAVLRLVEVLYEIGPPDTYVLGDRFEDPEVARAILDRFHGATVPTEAGGSLVFQPTHVLGAIASQPMEPVTLLRGEQSNSSIRFGDTLILKLFRRLQYGPNPDVEVGRFLTEHSDFRGTPPLAGSVDYVSPQGEHASLALLQRFERNRGDAWTTTLTRVRACLEGAELTESVEATARLGRTTAELHLALASGTGAFSAEPIAATDVLAWRAAIREDVNLAAEALARRGISVDSDSLLHRADGVRALEGALKARHHGDYHLGQVLERHDGSFVIIDFEGEPAKPLALRREKRSPLRDVAGMLRSFDYARNAALRDGDTSDPRRKRIASDWYSAVRAAFLGAYVPTARQVPRLLPDLVDAPLEALELEKAGYEVMYELNNRPDWLPIPLAALTSS